MKSENWLLCHIHAYEYFDGVPRLKIPDNLRTDVLKNTRPETVLNRSYSELADQYDTAIVPARARRLQDYRRKNVIGNSVKDFQNTPTVRHLLSFFADNVFLCLVMYQKSFLHLPFYRQSRDWHQKGVPMPGETAAHWYNHCALEYLAPIYEALHQELLTREVIHADEVSCQVLHEEGKDARSTSYRNNQGKQPEHLSISVHPAAVYAGL